MKELSLLQELEKNPIVSQRELSNKFGIALGVTNACLKRMVRRGWIRITSLNHHKIGYFLTPKGFAEKTKLTIHLISWTAKHYSALKDIVGKRLLDAQNTGLQRIAFYGISDEMEIAYITLQGLNLKLVGIVSDGDEVTIREIFGFKLTGVEHVMSLNPEVILITSLSEVEERKMMLEKYVDFTKVKVISLCN